MPELTVVNLGEALHFMTPNLSTRPADANQVFITSRCKPTPRAAGLSSNGRSGNVIGAKL